MQKSGNIVRYTAEELKTRREKFGTQTDWARVDAMTEEELEAAIASDPDEAGMDTDMRFAYPGLPLLPENKQQITLRIDADVLEWFKDTGKGYQTRINDALRRFVGIQKLEEERRARAEKETPRT
jgi:uncharacterized protein (DUF4415 family)